MDPDEDLELGAHVQARVRGPAAGAVVAVRLTRDLLVRLSDYGQRHEITVSEVLRRGAERLVEPRSDLPAQHK